MAAGGMHSVALAADGQVYTCGVNDEGALGRETSACSPAYLMLCLPSAGCKFRTMCAALMAP